MTYNVQLWQRANVPAIISEIRDAAPDILCLQDARGASRGQVSAFLKGWHVASAGQYVIASKFPFVDSTVGDISYRGEAHSYLRARVDLGGKVVTVVNAHFVTPRDALTVLRTDRFGRTAVQVIRRNLSDRITQARTLAEDVRHVAGPVIVAGDLNAPPPALASRALTDAGLVDTFARSGRGYGYTFGHTLLVRQSFLRIDRILASDHFFLVRTTVGGADGADHRPVICGHGTAGDEPLAPFSLPCRRVSGVKAFFNAGTPGRRDKTYESFVDSLRPALIHANENAL